MSCARRHSQATMSLRNVLGWGDWQLMSWRARKRLLSSSSPRAGDRRLFQALRFGRRVTGHGRSGLSWVRRRPLSSLNRTSSWLGGTLLSNPAISAEQLIPGGNAHICDRPGSALRRSQSRIAKYDVRVDLDPAYWLNLGRQAAIIVGIGAVFGGPAGIVTWRRTNSRAMTIAVAIGAAVIGLLVVGYIYLSVVLCPPGAGCV